MKYLTLALAKGRTAEQAIKLLANAGIHFETFTSTSRKLIFHDDRTEIKMIYVKAVDVPTYVETGAADIGIVGKDNIQESGANVYDMMDLKFGSCQFVVAGVDKNKYTDAQRITVATKYPQIATDHFHKQGRQIDTIKLNGSVELAPLIGMADVIVDIMETGTTLKENGLEVFETAEHISTRLIVNKASFATKSERVHNLLNQIQNALG
ncbi:ATP phosphoribosyltransferase [Virgibacillus phasianinus]|uniref:ATP phosphoribosyltransferase n=1 Tax=Virgibacillus phasianinus TaxID=2017483 RepID=A0A220U011_9BACI|nr:ATP phosphoribosyltransferase [Virgibacillus phasianinus]ASK61417.1 ATP phosphoribosyltransferase [Virgibacillus phasianinus]